MNIYIEQDNASYRWDIGQSKPTADQQNKDIVFLMRIYYLYERFLNYLKMSKNILINNK